MKDNKRRVSDALWFIALMGVVSLFSDMTHEGARSILGNYLNLAGASAATIGFVSGFGELCGYGMKRISTLILAVFMVCGLFCVSSAAADTEQWWEQDVWSTDVLVSLGAVLPDYDPASDTYRISAPEQLLYQHRQGAGLDRHFDDAEKLHPVLPGL